MGRTRSNKATSGLGDMCMCVGVYVCMDVCVYVCMDVCVYVCMDICVADSKRQSKL